MNIDPCCSGKITSMRNSTNFASCQGTNRKEGEFITLSISTIVRYLPLVVSSGSTRSSMAQAHCSPGFVHARATWPMFLPCQAGMDRRPYGSTQDETQPILGGLMPTWYYFFIKNFKSSKTSKKRLMKKILEKVKTIKSEFYFIICLIKLL